MLLAIMLILFVLIIIYLFVQKKQFEIFELNGKQIEKKYISNKTKPIVFVVSLEKDTERRYQLGITPDYIFAIDGSQLDIDKLKNDNIILHNNTLTRGEIGCYLSHVELLKKSILLSNDLVLILEDDATINSDIFNKINDILKDIPIDFEILLLGYNYTEKYNVEKISYFHGSYAYLVNTNNISLEKIDKLLPMMKPYDIILSQIFKTYIVNPKIVELGKYGGMSNTQSIR